MGQFVFGVVCVSVELAVLCCSQVYPSRFSQFKIWVFYCWFFLLGEVGPPSPKYSSMSGPSSFLFSLLSFLSSSRVVLSSVV